LSVENIFEEITEIRPGRFADVFKGELRGMNKKLAVKGTKLMKSQDKDFKILREVVINKQLKHENIVIFYEYFIAFDSMNTLFLNVLMELCDKM